MDNTNNSTYYIFREARNREELEALLRLRYEAFRLSDKSCSTPENEWGINIDCYDPFSMHLGFYRCENGVEKLIGNMRFASKLPSKFQNEVFEIARSCSEELYNSIRKKPELPVPSFNYFNGAFDSIHSLEGNSPLRLVEPGRNIFTPEARYKGLSRFVIECCVAYFQFAINHFDIALISCAASHAKLFNFYGFELLNEVGFATTKFDDNDKPFVLMKLVYGKDIPISQYSKLEAMAYSFNTYGCICLHPDHPGIFTPSTELTEDMSRAPSPA